MDQNLKKAFKNAKYEPQNGISIGILNSINNKLSLRNRVKLWIYASVSTVSFIGLFPMFKYLAGEFVSSGSYDYFSLLYSDGGSVMTSYWKDFTLSLVESLPLTSMILTLSLVFIFLNAIRRFSYQFKTNLLIT